jgi:hypothetical protein
MKNYVIILALSLAVGYASGRLAIRYHVENDLHNEIQRGVRTYIEQNELMRFNNLGRLVLMNEEKTNVDDLRKIVIESQSDYIYQLQLWGDTAMANFLTEKGNPTMCDSWALWRLEQPY